MKLEPLYRVTFRYRQAWMVHVGDVVDELLLGEGRCEGRLTGRFQGANRARRRARDLFEPVYHAVIETDDGAEILWDLTGYGRPGQGRVVGTVKHVTEDARYRFLNETLCAVSGTLSRDKEGTHVVLDVAELVWEPLPD